MSAPIQNRDKVEDIQLYAPPWARELPPPPSAARPQAAPPQAAEAPAGAPTETKGDVDPGSPTASPSPWPDAEAARPVPPAARSPKTERRGPAPVAAAQSPKKPAPRMAPGVGGPNLDWRPAQTDWPSPASRLPPFEGDLAVKALRHRLSLDPEFVPEPPTRTRDRAIMPLLSRLCLVVGVAAILAGGGAMFTMPDLRPIALKQAKGIIAAVEPSFARLAEHAQQPTARLVIEGRQAFANEPLSLGVSLNGATGGELALLSGLVAGTRLSSGAASGANGWKLPARELATAFAYAPKDFIGVMNAAIDLRSAGNAVVDRNVMRLEWIGKQPEIRAQDTNARDEGATDAGAMQVAARDVSARDVNARDVSATEVKDEPAQRSEPARTVPVIQPIDPEELAMLLKRGVEYLQTGDIAAARLMLRRAANAGNAQAALALGATYDPYVFGELGVLGFAADVAQARIWYERAVQLGAAEASRRIERLARLGR